MGGKSSKTTSNQQQSTTTTLPEWMTSAGQANYDAAQRYVSSPEATWSADKAAAYANPWTQQVMDRTVTRMRGDNQVELAALDDQAQAGRAFGGTRHAVLEGQVRRDQGNRMLDYEAGANADAYREGRSAFEADRAAKMSGYGALTQILQGTPRNVSTSGTSSGTQTVRENPGFLNTMMGLGLAGASAAGGLGWKPFG